MPPSPDALALDALIQTLGAVERSQVTGRNYGPPNCLAPMTRPGPDSRATATPDPDANLAKPRVVRSRFDSFMAGV